MTYAIINTQKIKCRSNLAVRLAHNLRVHECAAPNADPQKRQLNCFVGATTIEQADLALTKRLATVRHTIRKDAVRAVEILLSASLEWFQQGSAEQQELRLQAWTDASLTWLKGEFGEENLLSTALHRDERTPHIQSLVVPITEGRLSAFHWLGGPAKLSALQDRYSSSLAHLGLRRGHSRRENSCPAEGETDARPAPATKQTHLLQRDFYAVQAAVVQGSKKPSPRPPELPTRTTDGFVEERDWEEFIERLKRYQQDVADLHAHSLAARILMASEIGNELGRRRLVRLAREAGEAAALRQRKAGLDAAEEAIVSWQKRIAVAIDWGSNECGRLAESVQQARLDLERIESLKASASQELAALQQACESEKLSVVSDRLA